MVSEKLPSLALDAPSISLPSTRNALPRSIAVDRPAAFLLISIWFGLLAGFAQVLLAGVARFLLHHYTHLNPHIVWMTPVAEALLFGVPGFLLFILSCWWTTPYLWRAAIFVFAFLASISVLLRVTWLHEYAAVILAIGLSVQFSRMLVAHRERFLRFTARTVGFLVAFVLILAIYVFAWQALVERRALAKLPAPSANAPNLLLIVLDTVGAQHLSLYGYDRPTTPQLERLAKNGVLFEQAISTAPWTLPSHASMFTGRYPHELSVQWHKPLDSTYPTLAQALAERGYLTAGYVGNTVYCSRESGLNRGFAHYEDFPLSARQLILNSSLVGKLSDGETLAAMGFDDVFFGRKTAEKIDAALLSWLSQKDPQRPFFAFLNYFDAHAPYLPPKPFDSMFGSRKPTANSRLKPNEKWSETEVQAERDSYDNSLAYLDSQIGVLLGELQRRGLLENTLVVLTSDHGEEFYEHGVMAHGWSTYFKALHVPLLISFPPRTRAGLKVSAPVTLRDLPATIIDLLDLPNKIEFPGNSLAHHWRNSVDAPSVESPLLSELGLQTKDVPERYPILKGNGDLESLVLDGYHYIKTQNGGEELYDIQKDLLEEHDLAHSEDARQTLEKLRAALQKTLAKN